MCWREAAEPVLRPRELVVECVCGRDPERARDEWKLVGRVGEREVEAARARVASERAQTAGHRSCFPERACPGVFGAHHVVVDVVQREQLHGLGVFPRRDRDVVAAFVQERDERPEERHLGRVRDVDPDPHHASLATGLPGADCLVYIK